MKSYRVIGCVLVASLVCVIGTVQADLVPNGGFTTEAELQGWKTTGGVTWTTTDGSPDGPSAHMEGNTWLYQPGVSTPSLVEGETYQLSFLATAISGSDATLRAGVSCTSGEYTTYTALTNTWQQYSMTFTAKAADVGTSFQPEFLCAAGSTFGIDSVSLSAVATPEPSAVVLCATGIIGLLAYAWRKRK
jgi:hypothetical protein